MIFLFEDIQYNSSYLGDCIEIGRQDGFNTLSSSSKENSKESWTKINGVGYHYYNGRSVFVLPKVFYDPKTKTAFGEVVSSKGEDVFGNVNRKFNDSEPTRKFLSSLGLWLYATIKKYQDSSDKEKNGVNAQENLESVKFKKNERCSTLPDIVSSMEMFYKKNQSLFVFVAKCKHSGNHKIDWHKTVSRKTPFLQNGVPIYMETVNKIKAFDLDDRLLVLYFSAMNYVHAVYGMPMPKSEFYQPLKVSEVKRLLEDERGVRELRRIKYKYFDDRLLKLYNIVESFFRWGAEFSKKDSKAKEYLIVNSFNNVFEAMIDELIGDPDANIQKLKHNDDGKIIDHLYKERSLVFANDDANKIWHIGDSKYYREDRDLSTNSIAKQFTYAKNLMQDFFSTEYFEKDSQGETKREPKPVHKGIHYRDELTEGYNITPNFFIRGYMPSPNEGPFSFDDGNEYLRQNKNNDKYVDELIAYDKSVSEGKSILDSEEKGKKHSLWEIRNRHFENRLFDRDTLLLQVYNVNFLYVLKAYTSRYSSIRDEFKKKAHDMFRKNFLELLDKKYTFWAVYPRTDSLDTFVTNNFRMLQGKMFRRNESDNFIILALEKNSSENKQILTDVKNNADLMWVAVEQFMDGSDVNSLEVREADDGRWSDRDNGFYLKKEIFEERVLNNTTLPKKLVVKSQDGNAVIRESLLNGGVIPDYSPNGEYDDIDCYFLPCKQRLEKNSINAH